MSQTRTLTLTEGMPLDAQAMDRLRASGTIIVVPPGTAPAFRAKTIRLFQDSALRAKA